MEMRGDTYGDRLRRLYEAATADWDAVRKGLGLPNDRGGQDVFWSRLFDVVAADLDDRLACHLHGLNRGYGHLASRCPVVPTRLPDPCGGLVTAVGVKYRVAQALADEGVQRDVLTWPAVASLSGSLVSRRVASRLRRLGFDPIGHLSVADALARQLGRCSRLGSGSVSDSQTGHVDAALAVTLGKVINVESIETTPLDQERTAILDEARQSRFRCRDGEWRSVRHVSARLGGEEDLLCDFAPDSAVLNDTYRGDGLGFFKVARSRSGYGPQARALYRWVRDAGNPKQQRAALHYLLRGRQRDGLADEMRRQPVSWLPDDTANLHSHHLLADFADHEKTRLVSILRPEAIVVVPPKPPLPPPGSAVVVLSAIHEWWRVSGQQAGHQYQQDIYPASFDVFPIRDSRLSWFTLFAIARFQNLGRVRDATHRTFIDLAMREGWWEPLATATGNAVAVDRLEAWSGPEQSDHRYRPWRNTLVDLYTFSRGLDAYSEVMRRLPRIIREEGRVSLRQLLYPAQSHVHMRLGTVAAPIDSPIGFGINWMIRELVRHGFYSCSDAKVLAPYCWSARARVRRLLDHLGANLGNDADMDASTRIWDFVRKHLDDATFRGDFDLPLHLITLRLNSDLLASFFRRTGAAPPNFTQWTGTFPDPGFPMT